MGIAAMPIIPPTLVPIGPRDLDADWDGPVVTSIGRPEGKEQSYNIR